MSSDPNRLPRFPISQVSTLTARFADAEVNHDSFAHLLAGTTGCGMSREREEW